MVGTAWFASAVALSSLAFAACGGGGGTQETCIAEPGADQSALLQLHQTNTFQASEKDASKGTPLTAGTVMWDGSNSFEVQRQVSSGFPAEVFFRMPAEQVGPINDTHVFIPFSRMLIATFVRDMHSIGIYEYGFAKWVFGHAPVSGIGPGFELAAAEKLHVFAHEGAWTTESLDKVRQEQASRSTGMDALAKQQRINRSAAVNMWTMQAPRKSLQILDASIDPSVIQDMLAFAAEPSGSDSGAFEQRMAANLTTKHRAYKKHLAANGGWPSSSSTAMNCHHFRKLPAIVETEDGFWVPFGTKLPSARGQMMFSPMASFGFMVGSTVLRHNKAEATIDIYQGAASFSHIVDPAFQHLHKPQVWVGPADGASRVVPAEGRTQQMPLSSGDAAISKRVYDTFQALPADFTFLWEDPASLCPPSKLEAVKAGFARLPIATMIKGEGTREEGQQMARFFATMIDCAADFLRSDVLDSHSYGPFESFAFIHGVMESPSACLQRGWNEIATEMFCPASGCRAAENA